MSKYPKFKKLDVEMRTSKPYIFKRVFEIIMCDTDAEIRNIIGDAYKSGSSEGVYDKVKALLKEEAETYNSLVDEINTDI